MSNGFRHWMAGMEHDNRAGGLWWLKKKKRDGRPSPLFRTSGFQNFSGWLFLTRWFSYDCRLFHLDKQAGFAAGHAGGKQGAGKMTDPERIVCRWRRHYIVVTGKAIFGTLLEECFHGGVGQLQGATLNVCSSGGHAPVGPKAADHEVVLPDFHGIIGRQLRQVSLNNLLVQGVNVETVGVIVISVGHGAGISAVRKYAANLVGWAGEWRIFNLRWNGIHLARRRRVFQQIAAGATGGAGGARLADKGPSRGRNGWRIGAVRIIAGVFPRGPHKLRMQRRIDDEMEAHKSKQHRLAVYVCFHGVVSGIRSVELFPGDFYFHGVGLKAGRCGLALGGIVEDVIENDVAVLIVERLPGGLGQFARRDRLNGGESGLSQSHKQRFGCGCLACDLGAVALVVLIRLKDVQGFKDAIALAGGGRLRHGKEPLPCKLVELAICFVAYRGRVGAANFLGRRGGGDPALACLTWCRRGCGRRALCRAGERCSFCGGLSGRQPGNQYPGENRKCCEETKRSDHLSLLLSNVSMLLPDWPMFFFSCCLCGKWFYWTGRSNADKFKVTLP